MKKNTILVSALILIISTNINCYTEYRCPPPVSKRGKLKQKLPKPPNQYKSILRRYE
jgi:hypothetical protein